MYIHFCLRTNRPAPRNLGVAGLRESYLRGFAGGRDGTGLAGPGFTDGRDCVGLAWPGLAAGRGGVGLARPGFALCCGGGGRRFGGTGWTDGLLGDGPGRRGGGCTIG